MQAVCGFVCSFAQGSSQTPVLAGAQACLLANCVCTQCARLFAKGSSYMPVLAGTRACLLANTQFANCERVCVPVCGQQLPEACAGRCAGVPAPAAAGIRGSALLWYASGSGVKHEWVCLCLGKSEPESDRLLMLAGRCLTMLGHDPGYRMAEPKAQAQP
eukprot:1160653-Pelagomonas_calceolata.AAC.6